MDFNDVLKEKMLERNFDTEVIRFVHSHSDRVFSEYDFDNQHDIEILNNKLEHIAQGAEALGPIDPARHQQSLESFLTVLSTKH